MLLELSIISMEILRSILVPTTTLFEPVPPGMSGNVIGYFAGCETVDEPEVVPMYYGDYNFVSSTGRDAGITTYQGSQYGWYIANEDYPRITTIKPLLPNMDSVIFLVGEMERDALEYLYDNVPVVFCSDVANRVMGFIRGTNIDYYSNYGDDPLEKWNFLCGSVDTSFISHTSNSTIHKMIYQDYLAFFVSSYHYSQEDQRYHGFNLPVYGPTPSNYNSFNKPLYVGDVLDANDGIDLPHMFASMDGIYNETGRNVLLDSPIINLPLKFTSDLVSWAGDLQTAARNLRNQPFYLLPSSFNSIMTGGYGFPKSDLLADVDAFNIAAGYLNPDILVNAHAISNAMDDYYGSLTSQSRYSMFIDSVLSLQDENWTGTRMQKFYREVYAALDLEITSFNFGFNTIQYTDGTGRYSINNTYYNNLLYKEGSVPALTRATVAKLFADYIRIASGE